MALLPSETAAFAEADPKASTRATVNQEVLSIGGILVPIAGASRGTRARRAPLYMARHQARPGAPGHVGQRVVVPVVGSPQGDGRRLVAGHRHGLLVGAQHADGRGDPDSHRTRVWIAD